MASSTSTGAAAPPPPPPLPLPQKESFVRRYRFLWPLLLVVNFSIGGIYFPFSFSFYEIPVSLCVYVHIFVIRVSSLCDKKDLVLSQK